MLKHLKLNYRKVELVDRNLLIEYINDSGKFVTDVIADVINEVLEDESCYTVINLLISNLLCIDRPSHISLARNNGKTTYFSTMQSIDSALENYEAGSREPELSYSFDW